MEFVGEAADGRTVRYSDRKRYLWLLSLTGPFHTVIAIALYFATGGNPLTMLYPLAYTFVGIPLVDALMGEDHHNPPEEVVRSMASDNFYRALLYVGSHCSMRISFWSRGTWARAHCRGGPI
jgi:alkane 1-monooxygenase